MSTASTAALPLQQLLLLLLLTLLFLLLLGIAEMKLHRSNGLPTSASVRALQTMFN